MIRLEVEHEPFTPKNYKVVQKLIALRPVYEIYDEDTGELVARAKQTWRSFFRSTMHVEDPSGTRLLTVKGGFFDLSFKLLEPDGTEIGKITRPFIAFRKKFTMYYRNDTITAKGGIFALGFDAYNLLGEYMFRLDKQIFKVRDQFRVAVGQNMNWLHAVIAALVIDRVFFKGKGCGCRCILILLLLLFAIASLLLHGNP